MTVRHCLNCGRLITSGTRCYFCAMGRSRKQSTLGRQRRGSTWNKLSKKLRQNWSDQGFGCVDAYLGGCRGRIQADHVVSGNPMAGYQPRCAYHNNKKH